MAKFLGSHTAKNPTCAYVEITLTPREAKILSMVLAGDFNSKIAAHFKLDVERVEQIITKVRRKVDFGRAKYAKAVQEAANKPCTVRSQEGEGE